MEFRVLGPLEALEAGQPLQVGGARQRALLAILVSRANEVLSTDTLVEELWGESPPAAPGHALQALVSRLRRALGADAWKDGPTALLVTRPPGYVLTVHPETIDARRFERLAAAGGQALATDPAQAFEMLTEGLGLWRGPAFAEFTYEPFAQSHIARLEQLRLAASEDRIEAELSLGRHANLVGELEALVAGHPFRERLRGQLMRALYRSGRQAEALEAYRKGRQILVEELGVDPGPELQDLEAAILRQDPALMVPAGGGSPGREAGTLTAPEEVTPLPPRGEEVRKTVTVVFADIAGSTALGARLDPEALREVMVRYFEVARSAFHRHGGTVEKFIGDAVMAVFGIPSLHEDDALRALRAASDLQVGLAELNAELERGLRVGLRIRIGVNTGEVVAGGGTPDQGLVTGDPVNTAARLQEAAEPGEILISEATYRLVAGAVEAEPPSQVSLKGKDDLVLAYRITKVIPGAAPYVRCLDAPLVGRQAELAQLRQGFDRAVRERTSFIFTVLGDPGIGKTRLAHEFISAVGGEATVLTGRCLPYGEGITYWPLQQIFHEAFGADVEQGVTALLEGGKHSTLIMEQVAGAIGLGDGPGAVDEIHWSVRMVLQGLALRRPLVLVLEDLHWAEDTFLDLVDHLVDLTTDAPMLLLCLARLGLLDNRPTWGGGRRNATTLELEPLEAKDARTLVNNLAGRSAPRHQRLERIMAAAEGNPLFLEQITAVVAERPAGSFEVSVPPTIQALLAARLEGLGPGQRAVLERAAVIGKEFDLADVSELLSKEGRQFLPKHFQELVRKRFIRPAPSRLGQEPSYRFRHILIQEATYRGMSKRLRAELHRLFGDWLRASGDPSDEILGYHLEQACLCYRELQPDSRTAHELAARASTLLAAAGRRALARGDENAAVNLLSRAASLLPVGDSIRLELLPELSEALRDLGKFAEAERASEEAAEQARARADRRIEQRALIERTWIRVQSRPNVMFEDVRPTVEGALSVLEDLGDEKGLGRAWGLAAFLLFNAGQIGAARSAEERAVTHASRAGDRKREVWSLVGLCTFATLGPTPVEEGINLCDQILDRTRGHRTAEATVLLERARQQAMRGNFRDAREGVAQGRAVIEELGNAWGLAMSSDQAADVEVLAGDLSRAEGELRTAYDTLRRIGAEAYIPTWAAMLGQVICAQRRDDEALELTRVSEDLAGADDITAQVPWRATRARIYARRGRAEEAERLAREAVELAQRTDWLNLHAEALMDLAEVLLTSGKPFDARDAVRRALEVWEEKGNLVSAARARTLLQELEVSTKP